MFDPLRRENIIFDILQTFVLAKIPFIIVGDMQSVLTSIAFPLMLIWSSKKKIKHSLKKYWAKMVSKK